LVSANPLAARATTIGTATQVSADTYELNWTIPAGLTDGRYELRAIAFGNGSGVMKEIDRDIETVALLQGAASSAGAAETVDITDPVGDRSLGFYTPAGRPAGAVVGVNSSATSGFVRMLYTTTRPGSEPVWKPCGAQPTKKAGDGVACVLAATDRPSAVNAIAAIANSTPYMDAQGRDTGREQPDPTADQAADAVRVSTYTQYATTLTMDPATHKITTMTNEEYTCSNAITVILTDQLGKGIMGANIDVHATGPSDQLGFEVVSLLTKNQAPDKDHPATEYGYSCTGASEDNRLEMQAEHAIPGGPDHKHIESNPALGSDDAGRFTFKLWSDMMGTTQIMAWVDLVDNDRFCEEEPVATATVGWGEEAAATEAPHAEACSGARFPRSIAMQPSSSSVKRGTSFQLAGAITAQNGTCALSQTVRLTARVLGSTGAFKSVARKTTSELGVFDFTVKARRSKEYRAVAPVNESCRRARSLTVTVEVIG